MYSNDSRRAAWHLYRTLKHGWIWATSSFIGNVLLAVVATLLFRTLEYGENVNYVFFLTVLCVGLWVTEAIPPFAVGIFVIAGLLLGFGTDFILPEYTVPTTQYLGTWTSSVIWLLLGGFFLAEGMSMVGLDKELFRFTLKRFGTDPEKLLLGLMLTTAVASMMMSNTATTAMMISSLLPLVRALGKKDTFTRALMVAIPAAATLGGMGTIIGSTPNAIAVGALNERGYDITFLDWMAFGVPIALLTTWLFWKFVVHRWNIKGARLPDSALEIEKTEANPAERRAVLFTLILTVSLWLTEPLHGIPLAATSAIPIVLLTLFQVIKAEDVRRLPWDTLMLVAGGLALGIAMVDVGLTEIIMSEIRSLNMGNIALALVFGFLSVLISNIMSNTAAAAILVPLGLALPGMWGFIVPLIVVISCSSALMLPVSTPSNAVAYATGLVEQQDFRPGGWLMVFLGPVLALLTILIYAWLVL